MDSYHNAFSCELASGLGTMAHKVSGDGHSRSIFHFQIPFPPDKEAVFLAQHSIPKEDRLEFYQNLVYCIQRNIDVSTFLHNSSAPSILSYHNAHQEKDSEGITHIYLETEKVWPIREVFLKESVSLLTLVDIIYRLALILRFTNAKTKEPIGVVHRGFDLNEVYINEENKILLGGFFYASCNEMPEPPSFLPYRPANLPDAVAAGAAGNHGSDIQALCRTAWNLLSGLPYDTPAGCERPVFPEFATEEILAALLLGLTGDETQCNSFRRKLLEARKLLQKTELAERSVPIRTFKQKQYEFGFI